jgi:hypothetical protein
MLTCTGIFRVKEGASMNSEEKQENRMVNVLLTLESVYQHAFDKALSMCKTETGTGSVLIIITILSVILGSAAKADPGLGIFMQLLGNIITTIIVYAAFYLRIDNLKTQSGKFLSDDMDYLVDRLNEILPHKKNITISIHGKEITIFGSNYSNN